MPKMTGAQALAGSLRSEGVDTIFGLPGVQVMPAIDALYEVRDQIRLVHTRHEQAAAYMADGYARVTGRPGVAMVVPGPGALNAVAAIGTAYASSSPVLLVSGQIPSASLGKRRGELHEVDDQLDVFKPITKWNHRVTDAGQIPEAVQEAFRQLKTGRPRPVELEIPPDTLMASVDVDLIEPEEYPRLLPGSSDIDRAAQLLAGSSRPAIYAGGGVVLSGASEQLQRLADYVQAPVLTSREGKGAVPEEEYLSVGASYASLGPAYSILPQSDVVLAVGTRFLLEGLKLDAQRVIHIDIDPSEIGKSYHTEVGIEADAREALTRLNLRLREISGPKPSRREEIEGYKTTHAGELRGLAPRQLEIVDTIRAGLADDAVVVGGVTNIGYWGHMAFPVRRTGTYVTSSYFATLGYAFPVGLGAKVAAPGRQVVSITGDGGFMYSSGELSTAVAHGINLVTILFNNDAFGASRWDQTHRFGGRYIATELRNPDFVKLAEAHGAVGMRTDPDGLGPALRKALSTDGPVLLEVQVPTMMPPFQIVR